MQMMSIARFIERNFLPLALAFAVVAMVYPPSFTWVRPHIPFVLGIIMFGMGLTLDFKDFVAIAKRWRIVGLGMLLQYTLMPLLALLLAKLFGLDTAALIGMVVVGACPGGTASNVMVYIARANVALSVTMTLASTCLAPILTPAIIYLLVGETVEINFFAMVKSVFWIVIFPLVDGLVVRHFLRKKLEPVLQWFPSVSIVAIGVIIACVIGLNQKNLLAFPVIIFVAVALHNVLGLMSGYFAAKACKCSESEARTLAIEVGMQNSGLGVALAGKFFGAAAALPGALFSLWHNVSGILLAKYWRSTSHE